MPNTTRPQGGDSKTKSSPISSTVWMGNISTDSSEKDVLDLATTIGKVIKFDFMYHDGKEGNIPRGYAFVTYCDYSVATLALRNLNGKHLNGRRISVQPANSNYYPKVDYKNKGVGSKESLKGLSIAAAAAASQVSKEDKIRAIEAKLKALEKKEDTFQIAPEKRISSSSKQFATSSTGIQHKTIVNSSTKPSQNQSSSKIFSTKDRSIHSKKPYEQSSHNDKRLREDQYYRKRNK